MQEAVEVVMLTMAAQKEREVLEEVALVEVLPLLVELQILVVEVVVLGTAIQAEQAEVVS
jgi:hypothetical protein